MLAKGFLLLLVVAAAISIVLGNSTNDTCIENCDKNCDEVCSQKCATRGMNRLKSCDELCDQNCRQYCRIPDIGKKFSIHIRTDDTCMTDCSQDCHHVCTGECYNRRHSGSNRQILRQDHRRHSGSNKQILEQDHRRHFGRNRQVLGQDHKRHSGSNRQILGQDHRRHSGSNRQIIEQDTRRHFGSNRQIIEEDSDNSNDGFCSEHCDELCDQHCRLYCRSPDIGRKFSIHIRTDDICMANCSQDCHNICTDECDNRRHSGSNRQILGQDHRRHSGSNRQILEQERRRHSGSNRQIIEEDSVNSNDDICLENYDEICDQSCCRICLIQANGGKCKDDYDNWISTEIRRQDSCIEKCSKVCRDASTSGRINRRNNRSTDCVMEDVVAG